MKRLLIVLAVLLGLDVLAFALALGVGSVSIPADALWAALTDARGLYGVILHELRLPRAVGAFTVGALLALAGALMQVLLRNPLADPYVLGVSGGAAVAMWVCRIATAAARRANKTGKSMGLVT